MACARIVRSVSILSQYGCRRCITPKAQRFFYAPGTSNNTFQSRIPQPVFVPARWHSAPSSGSKVYDFEQVRRITEEPSDELILIDVREPSELQEGYIPTAINIPIKSQPDALMLPEEEFEDRFGFTKPETDKEVVFYCRSGVRSSAAAQLAQQQGYQNVSEYRGSWLDWQKNGGAVTKF